MSGAIPPLLQYVFMAWCLVKHRDNFTFTFTVNAITTNHLRAGMELTSEMSGVLWACILKKIVTLGNIS
jgi:hypothetical protein